MKLFKFLFLAISVTAAPALNASDNQAADFIATIEGPQVVQNEAPEVNAMTIAELLEHFNVPGVSIAVIHDYEIHWAKGYGIADVETGATVDTETMFQAASISKPVNAMAVMKAVQDGKFGLDDDVNSILTSWQLDGEGMTGEGSVTPRNLASHTSGLGDAFGFPGYNPDAPLPSLVQILEGHELSNTGRIWMERPPYRAYEYSGGGIVLLQQALVDAYGGEKYEAVMQREVLQPIGMSRSSYTQPITPENDKNATRGHNGDGKSMGPKWHVYPEQAAAGLWTTPTDLAKFAIEVQKSAQGKSNRVLNRANSVEMLTPVGVGEFAVGFGISKDGEGWYFRHGGGNWGFRCTLVAHKLKGYGLAIMTNGDGGGGLMNELVNRIQRAYGWDSLDEPVPRGYDPIIERTAIELPTESLERFVGTYKGEEGEEVFILLEDNALFVESPGQGKWQLLPESEFGFFIQEVNTPLTFRLDESGEVIGYAYRQSGRDIMGEKIQ